MLRAVSFFYYFWFLLFLRGVGSLLFAPLFHLEYALLDCRLVFGFQHYAVSAHLTDTHSSFMAQAVNSKALRGATAQLAFRTERFARSAGHSLAKLFGGEEILSEPQLEFPQLVVQGRLRYCIAFDPV